MNKSQSKYFNTALRMDEALITLLEKKEDRLDNDFVIAGNKRIKVYSHISGNRPNDLLVCKVASNRQMCIRDSHRAVVL